MTTKVHLPVCRHENLFGIVSAPIETQSGTIGEFFVSQVRDVAAQIPALMENGDISIEVGYPPSDSDDPIRPLSKSTWRLKIELNISAPDDSLRREAVMGICYLIYNSVKNQSPLPDDPTLIEQTRIEVVSPNWIIGGADQVKIPTGGPGSNKADVILKASFRSLILY